MKTLDHDFLLHILETVKAHPRGEVLPLNIIQYDNERPKLLVAINYLERHNLVVAHRCQRRTVHTAFNPMPASLSLTEKGARFIDAVTVRRELDDWIHAARLAPHERRRYAQEFRLLTDDKIKRLRLALEDVGLEKLNLALPLLQTAMGTPLNEQNGAPSPATA